MRLHVVGLVDWEAAGGAIPRAIDLLQAMQPATILNLDFRSAAWLVQPPLSPSS